MSVVSGIVLHVHWNPFLVYYEDSLNWGNLCSAFSKRDILALESHHTTIRRQQIRDTELCPISYSSLRGPREVNPGAGSPLWISSYAKQLVRSREAAINAALRNISERKWALTAETYPCYNVRVVV